MAVWGSLLECHTDGCHRGCTYPFLFLFPAAILYAVLQANNVGLLCSVLFVPFLLSPLHSSILSSYAVKERKKKKKGKKKHPTMFCSFFHCQKLNGALYLDWKEFHMQSILKRKPALVNTFL